MFLISLNNLKVSFCVHHRYTLLRRFTQHTLHSMASWLASSIFLHQIWIVSRVIYDLAAWHARDLVHYHSRRSRYYMGKAWFRALTVNIFYQRSKSIDLIGIAPIIVLCHHWIAHDALYMLLIRVDRIILFQPIHFLYFVVYQLQTSQRTFNQDPRASLQAENDDLSTTIPFNTLGSICGGLNLQIEGGSAMGIWWPWRHLLLLSIHNKLFSILRRSIC